MSFFFFFGAYAFIRGHLTLPLDRNISRCHRLYSQCQIIASPVLTLSQNQVRIHLSKGIVLSIIEQTRDTYLQQYIKRALH